MSSCIGLVFVVVLLQIFAAPSASTRHAFELDQAVYDVELLLTKPVPSLHEAAQPYVEPPPSMPASAQLSTESFPVFTKYGLGFDCTHALLESVSTPDVGGDDAAANRDNVAGGRKDVNSVQARLRLRQQMESIHDSCATLKRGWWTYQVCVGGGITQYHEDDGRPVDPTLPEVITLGKFDPDQVRFYRPKVPKSTHSRQSKSGSSADRDDHEADESDSTIFGDSQDTGSRGFSRSKSLVAEYTYEGGTTCDVTKKPRSARVIYSCDLSTRLQVMSVVESPTCSYIIRVLTSAACTTKEAGIKVPISCVARFSNDDRPLEDLQGTPTFDGSQQEFSVGDEFEGWYNCQGEQNAILTIIDARPWERDGKDVGQRLQAIVHFSHADGMGYFELVGGYYRPSKHLDLRGARWFIKPKNFGTVSLDGVFTSNDTISGVVPECHMAAFQLQRRKGTVRVNSAFLDTDVAEAHGLTATTSKPACINDGEICFDRCRSKYGPFGFGCLRQIWLEAGCSEKAVRNPYRAGEEQLVYWNGLSVRGVYEDMRLYSKFANSGRSPYPYQCFDPTVLSSKHIPAALKAKLPHPDLAGYRVVKRPDGDKVSLEPDSLQTTLHQEGWMLSRDSYNMLASVLVFLPDNQFINKREQRVGAARTAVAQYLRDRDVYDTLPVS